MAGIIAQALRDYKMAESLVTEEDRNAIKSARVTLMTGGGVAPNMAKPLRTPLELDFLVGNGQRRRAARAGKGLVFASHATTPATSGHLILRLFEETETQGRTLRYVMYHPAGQRTYSERIDLDVLAGSWWDVDVQTANGASGISASFVVDVG